MPLHIRRGGSTSYVPLSSSDPDLDDNTPPQHDMDPTTMKSGASDEEDRKSVEGDDTHAVTATQMGWLDRLRSTYHGALSFNMLAYLIPAIYVTLSKMWIAQIDSSLVSTLDAYTYFGCIVEVLNEGLPRAAWSTIGSGFTAQDAPEQLLERLSLTFTLISVQAVSGFVLSVVFLFAAPGFVGAYVPGEVKDVSVKYIRILAFDSLASTVSTAVSFGTRAMDKPDVPLFMSTVQTLIQIFLELALISTVRIGGFNPTIHTAATIKLVCDLVGAAAGLIYFLVLVKRTTKKRSIDTSGLRWFSFHSFKRLFYPGRWTFTESAIRNAIYLYQIHGVVSMGQAYATAWGVFSTIRWGIVMVPVNALQETSNAFVGHRWGANRRGKPASAPASWSDIRFITSPALLSALIALVIELALLGGLAIRGVGAYSFAKYLSNSDEVARITAMMWKTIDWCYICYAISTQLATLLLATQTKWYLSQSLVSNLGYALPWAIALPRLSITPDTAWGYHKWVFGGSLVVSLGIILVFDMAWVMRLRKWKIRDA